MTPGGPNREGTRSPMTEPIRAIRGFRDVLPDESWKLALIEEEARAHFARFGYREVRLPLVESTDLFSRGIGTDTDIVEKEMYTFPDRNGQSLTLRPEGTASVVRAFLESGLRGQGGVTKFFYSGPMFRYERPQKGRYRQFSQMGVEALGGAGPLVDAEVIACLHGLFAQLGVEGVTILVNSLGCSACRPGFREALLSHLRGRTGALCENCLRRMDVNPLRVLDCKVPRCREALSSPPSILDHLCPGCVAHFGRVREALDALGVPYRVDGRIVRGLDYYTRTAFEAVCERLGAQNAVAAGGRYDGLAMEVAGEDVPGIGFAVGLERLSLIMDWEGRAAPAPDLYVAAASPSARIPAQALAGRLRRRGWAVETDLEERSLKAQLRSANRLGAPLVAILGDEEMARGTVQLKDFVTQQQTELAVDDLLARSPAGDRGQGG
jgi:histidyl-tRNA synthetase